MALLFKSDLDSPEAWRKALSAVMPALEFRVWPETGPLDDIEVALVWAPEPGDLKRYPNLRLIASLGAGVDNILSDPDLPAGVPVTRIVDPELTRQMTEYSLFQVLRFHRRMLEYEAQQRQGVWRALPQPLASERKVGLMGLGVLGTDLAGKLVALGFDVAGWSRGEKRIEGVASFSGGEGFQPFLRRSEILVCLLPLTPETEGIIRAGTLGLLPRGAYVINGARGEHVIEDDLLAALDSGQIAGAALDVFRAEPLPASHPFWRNPKVALTPHAGGITTPTSAAPQIAENIQRLSQGRALLNQVDRLRGY